MSWHSSLSKTFGQPKPIREAIEEMDIGEGIKKTLIKGRLVIDGMGNPPIQRGAILVEEERILRVGKEEEFKGEANIHVLDCGDQTLLPGLIDCHNHLSLDQDLRIIYIEWLILFPP